MKKSEEKQHKPKKKIVSIAKKLAVRNVAYMSGLTLTLLIILYTAVNVLTQDTLRLTLQQVAVNASNSLSSQIYLYTTCMHGIADSPYFENPHMNKDAIIERLEKKSDEFWAFTSFVGLDGIDYRTGMNYSTDPLFTRAMAGESYVTDPFSYEGKVYYLFSTAAIYEEQVVGVIYMMSDYDYIYSLAAATAVGETGKTYVISTNNAVIIDEDILTGMQVGASKHLDKTSSQLEMEEHALDGLEEKGAGFDNYTSNTGKKYVAGYAPISGTDGWILITVAERDEFLSKFSLILFCTICFTTALTVLLAVMSVRTSSRFVKPITECADRISALAEGDVFSPVPEIHSNDEAGILAESTASFALSLSKVIKDVSTVLSAMADGDFTVTSQYPEAFVGEFSPIYQSLVTIQQKLNYTLTHIHRSSEEVNSAASQVASASNTLADGTSKQEVAAKELAVVIEKISEQMAISNERAIQVKDISHRTGEEVRAGNEQIEALVFAMQDITESAAKIEEIIKGIEDIAFQTNILALNASVEAARAGMAGRGFAVVAEEVRNLSIRSSTHVEETAGLVEATMRAVENGTKIAKETSDSMKAVVEEVDLAIVAIQDITQAIEEQSGELSKINSNMEDITNVIVNTSVATVESASTSEELSAQANDLQNLIDHFRLK